jgi:hypothetical protein
MILSINPLVESLTQTSGGSKLLEAAAVLADLRNL